MHYTSKVKLRAKDNLGPMQIQVMYIFVSYIELFFFKAVQNALRGIKFEEFSFVRCGVFIHSDKNKNLFG